MNEAPPLAPIRLALGARDAALALGVSERSFRRGLACGRIPPGFRLGKRRLWPVASLERLIEDLAEKGARG